MKEKFPIHEVVDDVRAALRSASNVILQAPPGAGKSTILPLELINESFLGGKKMIMLEPRKLAARSVAQRMASLLNEPAGETVGYRVRFETKVSAKTKIEIVTEGILTRMLQNDSALENYSLVIFDEFHERSLHTDLSLALCLQSQEVLRADLKLLIMSATLDAAQISSLLRDAPVITSKGRQFPVDIIYSKENVSDHLHREIARTIRKALEEQKGDVLAFLPGAGEIARTQQLLEDDGVNARVVPLYGDLSFEKQQEAILPDAYGRRKVILSTSIAETSLTIEGISTVVDSGYARVPKFDTKSGLTRLETVRVSKDSADQRAGRAGRLGPGVCYRMWTEGTHLTLAPQRKPEILEADLAPLMLEIYNWGANDVNELTWVSPPPFANVAQANDLLESLGAIIRNKITAEGKKLLSFPTHPRIAHMFLLAKAIDEKQRSESSRALAADVAALFEERDPLEKGKGADVHYRLLMLKEFRKNKRTEADRRLMERIVRLADVWMKMLNVKQDDYDDSAAGDLISAAYPERIARQIEKNKPLYKLSGGKVARLHEGDPLIAEEWLAVALMDAGRSEGKIFLAASLNPASIIHLAQKKERVEWDERAGRLVAKEELAIGHLVLSSSGMARVEVAQRINVICNAIRKEGLRKFGWDEDCDNWQSRVMGLRIWNGDSEWPDVSEEVLLATVEDWLSPYLQNVNSKEEIRKLNWREIVLSVLTRDKQKQLDMLAPEKISVPSGSSIPLQYFREGKAPELHVRLQEVFGMRETPKVNNGKINVVLHLLSPGFKPVQVTKDLDSFWKGAYHEVRKELQRRYPKHSWPEDPYNAQAVRGPKKRIQ